MVAGETKFKIVLHLYQYGPKTLSELASALHMDRQKIHYNLTQLMKEGVVLKEDNKYFLQPLFSDEVADFYLKLIYLITDISEYLILPEDVDINTAIAKNFEYYILLTLNDIINAVTHRRRRKRIS